MKAEILQILEMQKEGKLTQDQAAELLAMLADRAREQESFTAANPTTATGAPGPQAGSPPRSNGNNKTVTGAAASTIHNLVDTAVGVSATIGRAASTIGGEFVNMVHREQAGNSITLSKVDAPTGDDFTFRGNSINVSKVAHLTLNHADLSNNSINASQLSHVTISGGRLAQCSIAGSSISHITLEGSAAHPETAGTPATDPPVQTILRASTFNATKFARVRLLAGSQIDACTFQAAAIKDVELSNGSALRDSRVCDSAFTASRFEHSTLRNFAIERSQIQALIAKDTTIENVSFSATRASDTTITGGTWTSTRFGRDALGTGSGGQNSSLQETVFDNCNLTNVEFLGCIFRRTALRNLTLSGLTVRNVDFTGLTLDSEEAFKKAAGLV